MPFRKKVFYYGLLLLLTLLALEGMARAAYYAAYGDWYGGGGRAAAIPAAAIPAAVPRQTFCHPFYGGTEGELRHALNAMPPRLRREDTVLIGLLGGSVATEVQPFLEQSLRRWFAANDLPREPAVVNLSAWSVKQPQQTMMAANTLLLGGEFDLLVNLDGFNEISGSLGNSQTGVFPFFPLWWDQLGGLAGEQVLLAGRIGVLRREQGRLAAVGGNSPLRRSALFGLANRYRQEKVAAEIIQRNRELAAAESAYSLAKYGARGWPAAELLPAAARLWYRSSLALARLAELSGAEYYHFLQPNQYVPNAKPLSAAERERAYAPGSGFRVVGEQGYPLLRAFGRALPRPGVNYFDLTGIFVDHPETLYIDRCCHLNDRGNELLAAAIVGRMAPALLRLGGERRAAPVSALAAARRPAADVLLVDGVFQVYRQGDSNYLRYVRADCAPADVAARFFLHLTPRDGADLPAHRREQGFDNRDFAFAAAGGRFWQGKCRVEIPLPDYPIAYLRTGQYAAGAGEVWAGGFAFWE